MIKWVVSNNHLALIRDGDIKHPNATFLLDYLLGEKQFEEEDTSIINPRNISIARIGVPLKVELTITSESSEIELSLYVNRYGERISVDMSDHTIIDHGYKDGNWFYITGPIVEFSCILECANITQSGKLTLKQYLDLLKLSRESCLNIVENQIDMSLIDKPIAEKGQQPENIETELYPYQKIGYAWLKYMANERCGCILGDEMGLGKTLQVISLMSDYVAKGNTPILVVTPVSLLENWRRELIKFAPTLTTIIHHGSRRTGRYQELQKYEVVITSYSTAVSDLSMLRMIHWPLVNIDEAQNIKNPASERAKTVKMLPRDMSIAISGTPFENHITDIWSIVDFVFPDYLGALSKFKSTIADDIYGAQLIEPLLTPIMIRRLVRDVANDLPNKIIIPQPLRMTENEGLEYEKFRLEALKNTENSTPNLGLLQKIRMYCTHPNLVKSEPIEDPVRNSTKYERLCEILDEIIASREKVLIFTSYKKMFDIFLSDLSKRYGVAVLTINGETPVELRQKIVDNFSKIIGSAIFILNPRAAGIGLNITAANHVIHYNLEWNPSLEDQSSARAFRKGQEKPVFIHRLFYLDSVEQIVNERIERKRAISDIAIVGISGKLENREDISNALLLSPLR